MAKATKPSVSSTHRVKPHKKRPGVHAKTKSSKNKNATNYKKRKIGQGN
jgi:hypothetical protein